MPLTRLDLITFSCIRLLNGSGRLGWTEEDLGGEFLANLGDELYHLFPEFAASPLDWTDSVSTEVFSRMGECFSLGSKKEVYPLIFFSTLPALNGLLASLTLLRLRSQTLCE